jgi:mRNA-degrading endonuclease toxin of MazEF toxin-antitoxin module
MTACRRGDVVLVAFVFSEETGTKLRPALEVIVAAITSNVRRRLFGDQIVGDWQGAGLLFPSVVTGTLRTVKRPMIQRRLGAMGAADLRAIDAAIRRCLAL